MCELLVDEDVIAQIRWHATRCYPTEAVGVLGAIAVGAPISAAVPLTNHARHAASRVLVSNADLDVADADLASLGLCRVGAFHSHPRSAAVPSIDDIRATRAEAVEIIVTTTPAGVTQTRAWHMRVDLPPTELALRVVGAAATS